MSSLSDSLADFPLEIRQKLFESHVKPFGADVHHRMHLGKKAEDPIEHKPGPCDYNKHDARDILGPKSRTATIKKDLKLYQRPPSPKPEYYDAHKPFGSEIK